MGRAASATPKEREEMPASIFCGSQRSFPIEDAADVRAAAHLIGKADDPEAVKSCIIRKARAGGFLDAVPDAWLPKKDAAKHAPTLERPFHLDATFKAATIGDDGTLVLRGYASTYELDRDREAVTPQAFTDAVGKYMRNPVLLADHNMGRPIGTIVSAVVDANGLMVEAHVPPPPTGTEPWHIKMYSDIKQGIVRAFSIGGIFRRDGRKIVGMDLCEISAVPIPANPSSLFAVVQKSFELPPPAGRAAEYDLTKLRTDAFCRAVDALPR
jgi:HK97 family phage prohead protease